MVLHCLDFKALRVEREDSCNKKSSIFLESGLFICFDFASIDFKTSFLLKKSCIISYRQKLMRTNGQPKRKNRLILNVYFKNRKMIEKE